MSFQSGTAGRFCICTANDLPVLTKFYLEVFPERRPEDLDTHIPDTWWAAIRTDSGDIRLAACVSDLGNMMVLVRPSEADSEPYGPGVTRSCLVACCRHQYCSSAGPILCRIAQRFGIRKVRYPMSRHKTAQFIEGRIHSDGN